MLLGLRAVGGHHDPLAAGETIGLDHPRDGRTRTGGGEGIECLGDRGVVDTGAGLRGGDLRGGHDLLGEGLAALQTGGGLVGAQGGDSRIAQGIGDARHQRGLGPDHDELGTQLLGEGDDGGRAGRIDGPALGELRHAGVARGREEFQRTGVDGGRGAGRGVVG